MNKKLLLAFALFLAVIPICFANGSMSFLLHYDNGDVSLKEIELLERSPPDFISQPDEGFAAGIASFNGSVQYARRFEFPLKDYDSIYTLDKLDYALIVPYFNSGRYFYLFDNDGKQIIKADLEEYAICNQNGICNPDYGETEITCREDCKVGMPVEEEKAEVPAEPAAEEELAEENKSALSNEYLVIGALAAVLLIIIIAIVLASRKKQAPQ
ncbi:MAG: hypothetical protein QME12_02450 [Nanoarchaeota archaeon]|nr:hypothetical protein [Nanoarchaeota archaeon]